MTIHRTPHNITPLAQSNSSLWLNSCYAKQESLHILQLKRQGTNWQRKFRLHIPCGVVLFLVQFENSISTTLVFTWKRLSWESSHCLSKGSSVWKGSNFQHLQTKPFETKSKQNNFFWISFFPWCSTPKIQLFSHMDVHNRNNNKIMLGDDEAPQQGLWRNSLSCLKGVLWEDHI